MTPSAKSKRNRSLMAVSNNAENLLPEDLDDFVAECDEHLSAARQTLLDVEARSGTVQITREQLDSLFRNFHTIKGLSGMVGARTAELLSHQLEAYLGSIRKGRTELNALGINVLLDGIGLLESAVGAFRGARPEPDAAQLTARIASLLPQPIAESKSSIPPPDVPAESKASASLSPERQAKITAAVSRGERAWKVMFVPSAEFASRDVNVNTVRKRLQEAGEILHAEPSVAPGGGVRFAFILITAANPDFTGWDSDGLTVEPYLPSAKVTSDSAPPEPVLPQVSAQLVRVDLGRLDDLMRAVGEMVLSRARLENGLSRVAKYLPPRERHELEETAQIIERQLRDLREGVMRVRMVPVRDLFGRMRLVARDLTRETGKDIDLVISGEETEIDKFVVERMADPMLHLVRNAVSHGLESTSERIAAGKAPRGRLTLRAFAAGGTIVLEVEDDGRGVQVEAVFARARAAGLIPANAPPDPTAVLDLICTPGFSTREEADLASGRGFGMDVARRAIESLGGVLTLDSRPQQGTRITARLPLTLVVADVLTIAVGSHIYAIPQSAVREVVPIEPGSTTLLENNELIRYHGGVLPLLRLGDVFHCSGSEGPIVALVVGEGASAVALVADRAIGLREVVVRPMSDPLVLVPGIGGATEMGDGRPVLILDSAGLARFARRRKARPHAVPEYDRGENR